LTRPEAALGQQITSIIQQHHAIALRTTGHLALVGAGAMPSTELARERRARDLPAETWNEDA